MTGELQILYFLMFVQNILISSFITLNNLKYKSHGSKIYMGKLSLK